MRARIGFVFLLVSIGNIKSQDTLYARQIIKYLTSEKCFGRGYVNNGLHIAEKYLVKEIKKQGAQPLFKNCFTQSFFHAVNTFPKHCDLSINGIQLTPGVDFILNPNSSGAKGTFSLQKTDSLHYIASSALQRSPVKLSLKNKLTFSVGNKPSGFCEIELDKNRLKQEPKEVVLNIENKLLPNFESKNIGCYVNGSSKSDSTIVFSAHYDHLGGIGKTTFFPGANDNASGVSVILNLLRYYNTHAPKYKTVFLLFAGEEAGLLGSKHFVENKSMDLAHIKFLINLDLLGTGDDGIMVVNGAVYEKEFLQLLNINKQNNYVKEIKKRGKAANSDHYWFSEAGVPCFFIYTMGGIKAYHDVYDVEKTLPLTDYVDVFNLIRDFVSAQ